MNVAMVTVGNPQRKTGGYLYHAQVYPLLAQQGIMVHDVVVSAADVVAQRGAQIPEALLQADVIMVDALARTAVAPYLATWQRTHPIVAMVHELPSVASGVSAADEAPLLAADVLIAVSGDGRERLVRRGVATERIVVAYPGCDRLGPPPPHAPQHPPVVLCVAQWIPRKGIDVLLKAWPRVPQHAVLALYGEMDADPQYAEHLVQLIADARLQGAQIVCHGCVDDAAIVQAYASATCFALPTRFEGYGMVFAEALWAGVPVVASAIDPVTQMIGDAGIVVAVDDVDALAHALNAMILGGTAYATWHSAAQDRGRELPRWSDTARQWGMALQQAVQRRRV